MGDCIAQWFRDTPGTTAARQRDFLTELRDLLSGVDPSALASSSHCGLAVGRPSSDSRQRAIASSMISASSRNVGSNSRQPGCAGDHIARLRISSCDMPGLKPHNCWQAPCDRFGGSLHAPTRQPPATSPQWRKRTWPEQAGAGRERRGASGHRRTVCQGS